VLASNEVRLHRRSTNFVPYWFCLYGGFVMSKKFRASSLSLRKNSQNAPCSEFVPDRVMTFTLAPELIENCASSMWDCTLDSEIASGGGLIAHVFM